MGKNSEINLNSEQVNSKNKIKNKSVKRFSREVQTAVNKIDFFMDLINSQILPLTEEQRINMLEIIVQTGTCANAIDYALELKKEIQKKALKKISFKLRDINILFFNIALIPLLMYIIIAVAVCIQMSPWFDLQINNFAHKLGLFSRLDFVDFVPILIIPGLFIGFFYIYKLFLKSHLTVIELTFNRFTKKLQNDINFSLNQELKSVLENNIEENRIKLKIKSLVQANEAMDQTKVVVNDLAKEFLARKLLLAEVKEIYAMLAEGKSLAELKNEMIDKRIQELKPKFWDFFRIRDLLEKNGVYIYLSIGFSALITLFYSYFSEPGYFKAITMIILALFPLSLVQLFIFKVFTAKYLQYKSKKYAKLITQYFERRINKIDQISPLTKEIYQKLMKKESENVKNIIREEILTKTTRLDVAVENTKKAIEAASYALKRDLTKKDHNTIILMLAQGKSITDVTDYIKDLKIKEFNKAINRFFLSYHVFATVELPGPKQQWLLVVLIAELTGLGFGIS